MVSQGMRTLQEKHGSCWSCTTLRCFWAISRAVLKTSYFSVSGEFSGVVGAEEGEGGASDSPPPLEAPLDAVKVEINTEKSSVIRRSSVLHLNSNSETKCYNVKDCYPLYIHPSPPQKNSMPLFISGLKEKKMKKKELKKTK